MKKIPTMFLFVILMLLTVISVSAQSSRVSLCGTVSHPYPSGTSWETPLTVTVDGTDYNNRPDGSNFVRSENVTPTSAGDWCASGVIPGTYDLRVREGGTLNNQQTAVNLASGTSTSYNMGELTECDVNADDNVNFNDITLMSSAFNTANGDPAFNANADLNETDSVNFNDVTLCSSSFGSSGPIEVSVRNSENTVALAPEDAEIYFDTFEVTGLSQGDTFTIQSVANFDAEETTGVAIEITYNTAELQVNSITPQSGFIPFSDNSTNGTIDVDYFLFGTSATGITPLAEIEFELLTDPTETFIEHVQGDADNLTGTFRGVDGQSFNYGSGYDLTVRVAANPTSVDMSNVASVTPQSTTLIIILVLCASIGTGFLWRSSQHSS